jgi:hypothetical protein
LPENTQYCLQCGTEVPRGQFAAQPQGELEFLKPAVTGGLFLGVLSALPLINVLNIVCCLWAQAGGGLGTWLLNKQRPGSLKYGDGAFVGVMSGLVGAFVATTVTIPIELVMLTPEAAAQIQSGMSKYPMSPAVREMFNQFITPGFNPYRTLFWLIYFMVLLGLFSMIGGILTVAIMNRKKVD